MTSSTSTRTSFAERVHDVDAALDTVGGTLQARSFAVVKRDGFLISPVFKPDASKAEQNGVHSNFVLSTSIMCASKRIAELIEDGSLRITVDGVYH